METFLRFQTSTPQLVGLNRTMQYGNIYLPLFFYFLYVQFKSYYVVWKQMKYKNKKKARQSLNRTMQYGNCILKPHPGQVMLCLNRTMQYGNTIFHIGGKTLRQRFKSYYVVWKRIFSRGVENARSCLNRTMQYGNQKTRK